MDKFEERFREDNPKFDFKIGDKVRYKKHLARYYRIDGVFTIEKLSFQKIYPNDTTVICYVILSDRPYDEQYGGLTWKSFILDRSSKIRKILKSL